MTDDTEECRAARDIANWLDHPQQHLNSETRRNALEAILIRHFDCVRARAAKKERVATVTMWGGVVGLIMTLFLNSSKILEVVGWLNAGT